MYTGFWITEKIGNNSFWFDQKNQQSQIYVAEVIQWTLDDLIVGDKPVFREKNNQGAIIEYHWLKNFIKKDNTIIFDNHNHALFFWYQAYKNNLFKKWIQVIHIDQHTDMNTNECKLGTIEQISEKEVFDFTNHQCNVGNFIQPAIQSWLIGSIELITTEYKLNNFDTNKDILQQEDYILDIDLDFWHPDMSIENLEKTLEQTRKLAQYAQYITIATSPYFLDQHLALDILKNIYII